MAASIFNSLILQVYLQNRSKEAAISLAKFLHLTGCPLSPGKLEARVLGD